MSYFKKIEQLENLKNQCDMFLPKLISGEVVL